MEQLEQVEMCLSVIMGHKELDTTNTHTQLRSVKWGKMGILYSSTGCLAYLFYISVWGCALGQ